MNPTDSPSADAAATRERWAASIEVLRPELHRYCARLMGSVVEGEDLVQDTFARALAHLGHAGDLPALRPWLFRTAHNAAIDALRKYEHKHVERWEDFERQLDDEAPDPAVVRAALSTFLTLPLSQRSAVILKDVLGYSLEETAQIMSTTVLAVKAALVRGRGTLKDLAEASATHTEIEAPAPSGADDLRVRQRLASYAALFNARDWEALKALISEECRLDLVSKTSRRGKEIHGYFGRYAAEPGTVLSVGTLEGRPVLLVHRDPAMDRPDYFIQLVFQGDTLALIRDFRYVPYIMVDAAVGPAAD